MADVDFNYFLARKYALLQQQADAGTQNAASGAIQASSGAIAAKAAAQLDTTRANLLPAESAATIAQTQAQARLLGEQANIVGPESQARIGQIGAETIGTNIQNKIAIREGLTPRPILGSALSGVMGPATPAGFKFSDDVLPRRRPGETELRYQDRINGL